MRHLKGIILIKRNEGKKYFKEIYCKKKWTVKEYLKTKKKTKKKEQKFEEEKNK